MNQTNKFRSVVNEVQARPGMYLHEPTYDALCALVLGYDLATDGGALAGFREWIITRLGFGNNLAWPSLVLHVAFPQSQVPRAILESSVDKQQQAIEVLFKLLCEFDDIRQTRDGIRRIYVEYEQWLRNQPWYRSG